MKGERSEPKACVGEAGAGGTLDKRSAVQCEGGRSKSPLLPPAPAINHPGATRHPPVG